MSNETKTNEPWRNCTNCSGKGLVQSGSNTKWVVKCPFCKGTGRVEPKRKEDQIIGNDKYINN